MKEIVQFYNGLYIYKNKHGIFFGSDEDSYVKKITKLEAFAIILNNYEALVSKSDEKLIREDWEKVGEAISNAMGYSNSDL